MSAHTPGRLVVTAINDDFVIGNGLPAGEGRYAVAVARREPDARRLAACWNACEGIESHDLELAGVVPTGEHMDVLHQRHTAQAERDSARAELDAMREAHTNAASERDVLRAELATARADLEKARVRDEAWHEHTTRKSFELSEAIADSRAIEANYEAALALLERVQQSYSKIMDDEQDPLLFDIRKFLGPKP